MTPLNANITFELNLGTVIQGLMLLSVPALVHMIRRMMKAVGELINEVRTLTKTVGRAQDEEGHVIEPAPGTILARMEHQDTCTDSLRDTIKANNQATLEARVEIAEELKKVTAAHVATLARVELQVSETNGTVKAHAVQIARIEGALFGSNARTLAEPPKVEPPL